MKHRVKVDVVTRRKGLFGTREIIKKKTVTVSWKEYCRMKEEKWNKPVFSEAERLAALYMMWEEELVENNGEEYL